MKSLKILLTVFFSLFIIGSAHAVEFKLLVLPADIFNVCRNYFCFPEASEIAAAQVIDNLNSYKNISAYELSYVRSIFAQNPELKEETELMLDKFSKIERVDFNVLDKLSKEFDVKSVLLISTNIVNEETLTKRNLWEILEITSAFRISHYFELTTSAVLTDNVNRTIMWSGRYSKNITNRDGYFLAGSQAQAASQLEKIKQYYKNIASANISQNIKLRFFPKTVRTFSVQKESDDTKMFTPNALEKLSKPKLQQEIDELQPADDSIEDYIFTF